MQVVNPSVEGFSFIAADADANKTYMMTALHEEDDGPGPGPATGDIPTTYTIQEIADE